MRSKGRLHGIYRNRARSSIVLIKQDLFNALQFSHSFPQRFCVVLRCLVSERTFSVIHNIYTSICSSHIQALLMLLHVPCFYSKVTIGLDNISLYYSWNLDFSALDYSWYLDFSALDYSWNLDFSALDYSWYLAFRGLKLFQVPNISTPYLFLVPCTVFPCLKLFLVPRFSPFSRFLVPCISLP